MNVFEVLPVINTLLLQRNNKNPVGTSKQYLYPSKVIKVYNHEVDKEIDYVSLRDIRDAFTYSESIRRARQIIQNDLGLYPPTNTKVKNKRKISEEIINNWFSNPLTKREQKEVYKLSNSIVSIYWTCVVCDNKTPANGETLH